MWYITEFKNLRRLLQRKCHLKIDLCSNLNLCGDYSTLVTLCETENSIITRDWHERFSCKCREWKIYCCQLTSKSKCNVVARQITSKEYTYTVNACRTCSTIICPHSTNQIIDLWPYPKSPFDATRTSCMLNDNVMHITLTKPLTIWCFLLAGSFKLLAASSLSVTPSSSLSSSFFASSPSLGISSSSLSSPSSPLLPWAALLFLVPGCRMLAVSGFCSSNASCILSKFPRSLWTFFLPVNYKGTM